MARLKAFLTVTLLAFAGNALAQTVDARPASAAEFLAGYAGFVDDATIDHTIWGAAARVYLTPRLAIGPELVYMRGPNSDRDLYLTGNLTFDVLPPRSGRPRRVSPFLVAGGGVFQTREHFFDGTYTSSEGAFTAGGGVRAFVGDRVTVGLEMRLGWEPHIRINGLIGLQLGR